MLNARALAVASLAALATAATAFAFEPRAGSADVPPHRPGALLRWIREGSWRDTWTAEPRVHESAGPHGGRVRTWYNPTLVEDLAAGRKTFRKDAAMVKALYGSGSTKPLGWAAMVKVKDGRAARNWYFFETTDGRLDGAISGRGADGCAGCHSAGRDYLRSRFRP